MKTYKMNGVMTLPVGDGEVMIPTIEIDVEKYEELLAKAERLRLLENALKNDDSYALKDIKNCFGLNKGEEE